jgi:hypothetical protein
MVGTGANRAEWVWSSGGGGGSGAAISCPHCVRCLPGFERRFAPCSAAECAFCSVCSGPGAGAVAVRIRPAKRLKYDVTSNRYENCCVCEQRRIEATGVDDAGWSSPVARQAHNLKVVSSNLAPATNKDPLCLARLAGLFLLAVRRSSSFSSILSDPGFEGCLGRGPQGEDVHGAA